MTSTPTSRVQRREGERYRLLDRLTDRQGQDLGAQKHVYSGEYLAVGDTEFCPCVLYLAKEEHVNELLRREAQLLDRLNHKNIIRLLDGDLCDQNGNVVVAVQKPTRVGYDFVALTEEFERNSQTIPVDTMKYLLWQLADALEHVHQNNIVHRDLKPDNVLITANCKPVLIDFGHASDIRNPHASSTFSIPPGIEHYFAPELAENPLALSADLWGVGVILHRAYVKTPRFNTEAIKREGIKKFLPAGLDKSIHDALVQLLEVRPAQRWTVKKLKCWAAPPQRVLLPCCPLNCALCPVKFSRSQRTIPLFQAWRWAEHAEEQQKQSMFQVQVPSGWQHAGQNLMTISLPGNVLFIDRRGPWRKFFRHGREKAFYQNMETGICQTEAPQSFNIVNDPGWDTRLYQGDRVFIGMPDDGNDEDSESETQTFLSNLFNPSVPLRLWPEFDQFTYPDYCDNAVLGERQHARPGQNALHFRHIFRINVAGIFHAYDSRVTWWPSASDVIRRGDVCLVVRIFDHYSGTSGPILTSQVLQKVVDKKQFREALGLDNQTWNEWCANAGYEDKSSSKDA